LNGLNSYDIVAINGHSWLFTDVYEYYSKEKGMKGCRPLTDDEVKQVRRSFSGCYAQRNEALVVLGVACGFRISELLSLTVGDVLQHGKVVDRVTVARRHMKGGKAGKAESRTVRLAPEARATLSVWVES
jgi:integrase